MTSGPSSSSSSHPNWTSEAPRPVVPTPATMGGNLRGRRVIIGLPGHGWRTDLRADEKVIQGSRTYVPVIPESEWYRAEAEQVEVFAPLVPVERVWVEEYGMAGPALPDASASRLVSLDEPPRRSPVAALDAGQLTGRRVVEIAVDDGTERRDLRAVTEIHTSEDGHVCARVCTELDWYRWQWTGRSPRTAEVPVNRLWAE
ncbi:hypothetical protein [Actinoplanes aureus]|uniref:Uncharacterized protein n=1 Tax=Actinoplanes aureus TaxID=2792083 RepID=A0A931C0F0_9ACTN|nr:hypothetical protein [Actinoplanes aureus]MBG0560964.1 hypothetical protein [Actinoplanes aureus]